MSRSPKILAFAGSLRKGSYNKSLVRVAAEMAEKAGAEVVYADLRDYPMPLFDEDDEAENGLPDGAKRFRELMKNADGFLISCPEYNGAITGVLKNVIDWASRPVEGEAPLECFRGKTCALLAASPGRLGGIRGLPMTRVILSGIGVNVLAKDYGLAGANEALDDDGRLTNDDARSQVEAVVHNLVDVMKKLVD